MGPDPLEQAWEVGDQIPLDQAWSTRVDRRLGTSGYPDPPGSGVTITMRRRTHQERDEDYDGTAQVF
ncbi:unnamed protein product [Gadus morhua 'NCC']